MGFIIFILSLFFCVCLLSIDILHCDASFQIRVDSFASQDFFFLYVLI